MKKKLLSLLIVLFYCKNTYSANLVGISSEILFFPLLKNTSVTLLYGIKGSSYINHNIKIDYSAYFNNLNGSIFSTPITISYVPDGDYKFNIRPQIFFGINPFFSNIENFSGIKFYGVFGFGIDYVFQNNHAFNISSKIYINESFFKSEVNNYAFNSGVSGLNISYSIRY